MTANQPELDGIVLAVQVIPLVEVAAVAEPYAPATNMPLPKARSFQLALDGIVLAVQVMPLVEEAAALVDCATATNKGAK